MVTNLPAVSELSLKKYTKEQLQKAGQDVLNLMNLSGVDSNRDTHYNSKEELEKARKTLHREVFNFDRTLYGCLFCLPGVIDFSMQKAVTALLGQPRDNDNTILTSGYEDDIIKYLVNNIQPNKTLNMFVDFKELKINNNRSRRTALSFIFNSKNIELWSIKYRTKLQIILQHLWGTKITGVMRKILVKKDLSQMSEIDKKFIRKYIGKYCNNNNKVIQCVSFILGRRTGFSLQLLNDFEAAKIDITKGAKLPIEVLEGIATTYHPKIKKADILNLVKSNLTSKQTRLVQNVAKKAGVTIAFDPMSQPMVELYIYAFKMGLTKEIQDALIKKARIAANGMPVSYNRVGVLVDVSKSMFGSDTQPLKPISIALATRDMLCCAASKSIALTSSGVQTDIGTIVHPFGDTSLSEGLIELLEKEPNAVFIISDGYENTPAGRLSETLSLVRQIGCNIPVYHINPVAAAETGEGVRVLDKRIPVMPINKPEQLSLTMFKAALATDPINGILALVNRVIPLIESK